MPRGDKVTIGPASRLRAESAQAPAALVRQAKVLERPIAALVDRLRRKSPGLIVTCARGSSAHAATYGKHLFERHLGIPVCAAAPVIASIYRRSLDLEGQLFVSISQSGRSADIIAMAAMARAAGAITVAIVNDAASPLAQACELVLPIEAGPELSVAATKSFIATLTVLLRLTAAWTDDTDMGEAIERLPARLMAATELDWSAALPSLSDARSAMTIGRGPTLATAREAALKLKEVCNLHAEAFSGAEFQHGPIALVEPAYPVLMFTPGDQAVEGFETLKRDLAGKGALVFATARPGEDPASLPTLEPDHADADAICLVHAFYQLLLRVAERRGRNVDRPRHLQKVTVTR
jgi:glucosamine--fructose-6-phosphate aminotransferase (isomerizing)